MKHDPVVQVVDTSGTKWHREFYVYVVERGNYGSEDFKDFASTPEEARRKGKKYVHLGQVRIKERLVRTVEILPEIPVCT